MFVAEYDWDEVKKEASRFLKALDIKHSFKKLNLKLSDIKEGDGVFKIRLERLRHKKVKLMQYDQPVSVPAFLVDACEYLRDRIDTDGLFRKPGVMMRQKGLKNMLVSGGRLSTECELNPADVADLLKLFFRELPEPCIPFLFHDVLQRCLEAKGKQKDALFITLLMLPTEYLCTLAYLMQFLQDVAAHQQTNRMDVSNLAIVWTPNLMPFKAGQVSNKQVLDKRLAIVQLLIEHSRSIGLVPDCLAEHLSWHPSYSVSSHDEHESSRHREKKKKRRSGSLTRMLSGIRKMVQKRGSEEHQLGQVTPEQALEVPHTPRIMSTGKKRKASESNLLSFSAKKRKDLLELLPQGHLLPDVCGTSHLTPRVLVAQHGPRNFTVEDPQKKRRSRFYTCSPTSEGEEKGKTRRSMSASKLRLSHFGIGRKGKKKAQMTEEPGQELSPSSVTLDHKSFTDDYVRISRTEYEEIKNRMSIIESRISSEFENIIGVNMSDLEMTPEVSGGRLQVVQSAYERTLESSDKLSSSTSDELARRFSRELKIRGSSEKRIMRSPSARKIGSLRRRSKERMPQVKRNLSLNMPDKWNDQNQMYTENSLQRGKPNTVSNGLPEPFLMTLDSSKSYLKTLTNDLKLETFESPKGNLSKNKRAVSKAGEYDFSDFGVLTRSQARRASSFHGCDLSRAHISPLSIRTIKNPSNAELENEDLTEWKNAEDFLNEENVEGKIVTGRPSVARIRSENAGMVLAKAKLFSTMVDTDGASKGSKQNDTKSRELKKRNSSKSSKERKFQRKDSRNNSRKIKRVVSDPKQNELTDILSNEEKTKFVCQRKKTQSSSVCDNLATNSSKLVHRSLNKTHLELSKSNENQFKENLRVKVVQKKHMNYVASSPLRDKNEYSSPCTAPSPRMLRQPVNKTNASRRYPNVTREISHDERVMPKTIYCTPRRSPRQVLLKSRHLSKP